jgi:hypothetical protein
VTLRGEDGMVVAPRTMWRGGTAPPGRTDLEREAQLSRGSWLLFIHRFLLRRQWSVDGGMGACSYAIATL